MVDDVQPYLRLHLSADHLGVVYLIIPCAFTHLRAFILFHLQSHNQTKNRNVDTIYILEYTPTTFLLLLVLHKTI